MPSDTAGPVSRVELPLNITRFEPPGRVGVIGTGAFGRFCIDAYGQTEDLRVVAAADSDPDALHRVGGRDLHLHSDWQRLVDDPQIEVVHLAAPPHVRRDIVFASLRAGKSVFCEKPLALSLEDADAMITAARQGGMALGIDYVMRHHPAYQMLETLASSSLIGGLRTVSLQNFAQQMPGDHWFWDRARSGGILVEHGVHFFDAYRRVAGDALHVHGLAPRHEAVEVTVGYNSGVVGRFYHEFAFPRAVERTLGTFFFERGSVEIEGWIPTAAHLTVLSEPEALGAVLAPWQARVHRQGAGVARVTLEFPERQAAYAQGIVAGMRDLIARHRDSGYQMSVTAADARESLALAIAGQTAVDTGVTVELEAYRYSPVT